jgi:lantibiotic biosynthesis protein
MTGSREFLEVADAIAARLCRDALWDGARCNWLGPALEPIGGRWTPAVRAYGPDLYSGTSGIALFLGQMDRLAPERIYRDTAAGALRQALSRLDDLAPAVRLGFHAGAPGVAYALAQCGAWRGDEDYVKQALRIVRDLMAAEPAAPALDVVGGAAGAIAALLSLHRAHREGFLLDFAARLGDTLLAAADRQGPGWSWAAPDLPTPHNLTGFAHGAAGIGWALLELGAATGEARYTDAARQAFAYERGWFDATRGNWPDFRPWLDPPGAANPPLRYAVAWCHGAPGIGLSRLRAYALLGEAVWREEAETALRTTLAALPAADAGPADFSLCHGQAGYGDALLLAAEILGEPTYAAAAVALGRRGAERSAAPRLPWPCGVPGGGEAPNLMLGAAGIGHFYLRLHDPAGVPSVLLPAPRGA